MSNNANEAWVEVLDQMISMGLTSENTLEVINNSVSVPMAKCVMNIPDRKVNYRFMAAEAAYILAGRNDIAYLADILPRFANYSDDGTYQMGAYGPPFIDQLPYIIDVLAKRKESRQAVLSIWRQRPYNSKDIPCTLTLQYLIRDERLHLIVNMRSSDSWIGLVYDMFCFGCMGAVVAKELGVKLGNLHINMGSSHLYDKNVDEAAKLAYKYRNTTQPDALQIRPTYRREMVRTLQRIVDCNSNAQAYDLMEQIFG